MKRLIPICVLIGALAMAGCGSSDNESTSTGASETTSTSSGGTAAGRGQTLQLTADASQLKYDKTSLSASAGSVTIEMTNDGSLSHDVAIKGDGVDEKGDVVGKGGKSTVTADLEPGTYTFYCTVDGHEAAGMKGTLTVK
jgi:plastocyanin